MSLVKQEIICDDCGADFTIEYEPVEEIQYCPFCGGDLFMMVDDEEDDEYEDFDFEEEEQEE